MDRSVLKVSNFLKRAKLFYLSTISDGKPKCRPLGFHMVLEDVIYFGVGDFKPMYEQMQENPYIEICASVERSFMRYYGRAVFEQDRKIEEYVLQVSPVMKQIYNEKFGNRFMIFHLEEATAEFHSMMGMIEKIEFSKD